MLSRRVAEEEHVGNRPTLAIVVGLGWGARNYLLSDTLPELCRFVRPIVLSPFTLPTDLQKYLGTFDVPTLSYELPELGRRGDFLFEASLIAYFHVQPTRAHRRRLAEWRRQPLRRVLIGALAPVRHWAFPILRSGFCRYLSTLPAVRHLRRMLVQWHVDAIFSTNCFEIGEWPAVVSGKLLGLPVITAITSWDNPTTKRFRVVDYDAYLVWGEQMKREVRQYLQVRDSERIFVTGAPQFDYYFQPRWHLSRSDFCSRLGLDPRRKIIVYSTVTPGIMPQEPAMIALVHDVVKHLPGAPQLLVRLHPKDRLSRYHWLRQHPERQDIVWTLSGVPYDRARDNWCPVPADMELAANTVCHGDANVHCRFSTMMLDFAALDKPSVVIGFDHEGRVAEGQMYSHYEHLQPVIESGAVAVAWSVAELRTYLAEALAEPEKRRVARHMVLRRLVGTLDGQSGRRVAQAIRQVLHSRSKLAKVA